MCLNYLATFPDVTITQTKFYVMLCTDSDIAHLVEKNEKSRAGEEQAATPKKELFSDTWNLGVISRAHCFLVLFSSQALV